MQEAQRLYNLMRSYVGREWERVKSLEREQALEELERAAPTDSAKTTPPPTPTDALSEEKLEEQARKILGVEDDSDFRTIRKAFERLNHRSRPGAFPEESPEAEVARQLRRRVQWAYAYLSRNVSDTERRFGSLEID